MKVDEIYAPDYRLGGSPLSKGPKMSDLQKPGQTPQLPGEYVERGPRGGHISNARQVTMEAGDTPLPATSEQGNTWE